MITWLRYFEVYFCDVGINNGETTQKAELLHTVHVPYAGMLHSHDQYTYISIEREWALNSEMHHQQGAFSVVHYLEFCSGSTHLIVWGLGSVQ